jgi:hypothetical protein
MCANTDVDHALAQVRETWLEAARSDPLSHPQAASDLLARPAGPALPGHTRIRGRPEMAATTMPGLWPAAFHDARLHEIEFQRVFARSRESGRPE